MFSHLFHRLSKNRTWRHPTVQATDRSVLGRSKYFSVFIVMLVCATGFSNMPVFGDEDEKDRGSQEYSLDDTFDPEPDEVPEFILLKLAPHFQAALRAREVTSNSEVDFIGHQKFYRPRNRGILGEGGLAWWIFHSETVGKVPTSEFARRAGLLWKPNDGDAPEPEVAVGMITWRQRLFNNRVVAFVGKNYPGILYAQSDYSGDDRTTFISSIIAGDQVGHYFETIGLGVNVRYQPGDWFVQGGLTDAQAMNPFLDFNSLKKGKFLWSFEVGYNPKRDDGTTNVTVMPYTIDQTGSLTREKGLVLSFTHEFGARAYAVFGRYVFRQGGKGLTEQDRGDEQPLIQGGFAGFALNRPFGAETHQIAAAFMYGRPTDFKKSQGFNTQYGVEAFWKIKLTSWLYIMADLQFIRNKDDKLEFMPGLLFNAFKVW